MAEIVEFTTPKNVLLTGLLLGNKKASTCYIFIHGLGGSVFSNRELAKLLANQNTSVLLFNNRGHDLIARMKRIDKRKKRGTKSFLGGAAHEVFTESADDIEGAVQFAQSQDAKHIILVGHSTGSQKAVFYAAHGKNQDKVSGLVLLSPLSDYAVIKKFTPKEDYENILKISETLINQGNHHQLLPTTIWPALADAQRFVSLATPESPEDIFSYHDPSKKSIYSKITIPLLVIVGAKDEFRDRPMRKIKEWFDKYTHSSKYFSQLIAEGTHGFDEKEKDVAKLIQNWIDAIKK